MNQTFIIRSNEPKNNAINAILDLTYEPLHEVVIREHKEDRSLAQNSLQWMWYTDIARKNGTDKNYEYNYYKGLFLVPIYERDNKEYAEMINTLRKLYKDGYKQDAIYLKERIVELTHTSDATINQMTEYLKDIEHDANSKQIPLRHPDDYNRAMGIK